MLDKTYNPKLLEEKYYPLWENSQGMKASVRDDKNPFVIMMPPPNVTGSLHMGHALNYTLQDILIRYKRKKGCDALWQPGTDHAGIATQMVVERQLAKEGVTRHDLGRDKFIEKIWQWKAESGGQILKQQKRLGASPDWSRERFTMDEGLNQAVREVFVRLYNDGLIYRAERLVNWDPALRTAVSDLEIDKVDKKGFLYHLSYQAEDPNLGAVVVATTRPETLFGDTAVAVHPDDERYQSLIGKRVRVPFVNRLIPVIADTYSDPEMGTGAVKITPAHDFNDFEVGKRHQLEAINIFDEQARLNDNVPEDFRGLDRYEARKQVVAKLEEMGVLLQKVETIRPVPHGERSGVELEPRITMQWFVDAKTLTGPAIEAVQQGRTKIFPEHWNATYFEWLNNIQPWCISRQIWWGHQVPAWYGPDDHVFVAVDEMQAQKQAQQHYGHEVNVRRDTDVLDTWFSSALWPFSTLGWPEQTPELAKYYPGDVLITGFDIIFFWVARMMMMGLYVMKDVPFHTVYLNALVRDEKGQKMSKTKGNVIDPLDLVEKYGSDALRFGMASYATPGVDVKFQEATIEGYRNFGTKLWNIGKFCEHYQCKYDASFVPHQIQNEVNRWIVSHLKTSEAALAQHLEAYRFDLAAQTLYHFVWSLLCDWYVELIKPILQNPDHTHHLETQQTLMWVLQQVLHLLHPFMPFVTEALYENFYVDHNPHLLMNQPWPEFDNITSASSTAVDDLIDLIREVRALKAEMKIPPHQSLRLEVFKHEASAISAFQDFADILKNIGKIEGIDRVDIQPPEAASFVFKGATVMIPLQGILDLAAEKKRLEADLLAAKAEISECLKKLENEGFVAKAKPEAVAKVKERYELALHMQAKLEKALGIVN